MSTKIVLATPLFPPEIGGPATHAKFVSEELSKIDFDITVVPFSSVRKYPKIIRHFMYFRKLISAGKDVDIIYALDPVSVGLPAAFAARKLHKKFILRVAGDYAWEQGVQRFGVKDNLDVFLDGEKRYWLPVRILRRIQTFVAQRADAIIVPSDYFKTVIGRWGVLAKISVIYSAIEPLPAQSKADARRTLQISDDVKLIVSAGRLVPWKGFPKLIDIFAALKKDIPTMQLRIVGDGPERASLQEKITRLGLQDSVTLTGSVPQEDLACFISAADVFVLNTQYEGLSHQLIEVMQMGAPIVTTSVGGNVELITDDVSGLLVSPDSIQEMKDAVNRLLSDDALAQRLVAGARQTLGKFSPEVSLAQLKEILQK